MAISFIGSESKLLASDNKQNLYEINLKDRENPKI